MIICEGRLGLAGLGTDLSAKRTLRQSFAVLGEPNSNPSMKSRSTAIRKHFWLDQELEWRGDLRTAG